MTRNRSRSRSRAGFTLVELMVVIVIIAVLVSLVAGAVMKAMGTVPQVQTSTEIAQLGAALGSFRADFIDLTDPPPSVLVLNESNPLNSPSAAFLKKMFGKNFGSSPVDWNGDGSIDGPASGWVLEGEQCLVFYLGGIANQGFSYNSTNPTPVAGQKTHGPYFPFQTSRLVPLTTLNALAPSPFPVYLDSWQAKAGAKPYAYFSSNGINNSGYLANGLKDCQSIGASPYWTAQNASGVPTQFPFSNSYQIISAGKDGTFGGGLWSTGGGIAKTLPAYDDQANFSSTLLGIGQN